METMSKVWAAVATIWAAALAAIVYLSGITPPIWLLLALWFVPLAFIGTFISFTICEKKGWV